MAEKNNWLEDKFNRQQIADEYSNILKQIRTPSVIALHSPFGTGKTFFTSQWREDLLDEGYTCFHFDTWQTDFANSPLAPLIAQIQKQISAKSPIENKFKSFRNTVNDILIETGRHGVSTGISVATQGVISKENAKSILTGKPVEQYEIIQKKTEDLKKHLRKMVEVSKEEKIFFFVDELDRCRPDFALETLEYIKHLFDVEGIIFIVSVDREHLVNTLMPGATDIGQRESYSRRFFDLELSLPVPKYSKEYVVSQFQARGLGSSYDFNNTNWFSGVGSLAETVAEQAEKFGLSIREVNRLVNKLSVCVLKLREKQLMMPIPLAFLAILQMRQPKFYETLKKEGTSMDQLLKNFTPIMNKSEKDLTNLQSGTFCDPFWVWMIVMCSEDVRWLSGQHAQLSQKFNDFKSNSVEQKKIGSELSFYGEALETLRAINGKYGYPFERKSPLTYLIQLLEPGTSYFSAA